MKPTLHVVEWRDAHGDFEEASVADTDKAHKAACYYSAGILVKSDTEGVTLALDFGLPLTESHQYTWRQRSFIPRVLVVREYSRGPLIRAARKAKAKAEPVEGL